MKPVVSEENSSQSETQTKPQRKMRKRKADEMEDEKGAEDEEEQSIVEEEPDRAKAVKSKGAKRKKCNSKIVVCKCYVYKFNLI